MASTDGVPSDIEKGSEEKESRTLYSHVLSSEVATRWETFYLQKTHPGVTYSLTPEEIARFVYERLKIPEGKLESYDDISHLF